MAISKVNKYGKIDISLDAIGVVAGNATLNCYGVYALVSRKEAGEKKFTPLKEGEYAKGVNIEKDKNDYVVDLYLLLVQGIKIPEILNEVQKKVKYDLEKAFKIKVKKVNVHALDVAK